jgi:predicted RNase H-like nuclease/nicotinamide riboside kinase
VNRAKRVVIVGAESTGKTTLARELRFALAARGGVLAATPWVPEYGREYTFDKLAEARARAALRGAPEPGMESLVWTTADFVAIAREQNALEAAAERAGAPLIVCDTDAFATAIWHERYLGERNEAVEALVDQEPRLYLVTHHDDVPFEADEIRDGAHLRAWMTGVFVERLRASPHRFEIVRGTRVQRLLRACDLIDHWLAEGSGLADRSFARAVGVDGCSGGWIAVTRDGGRRVARLEELFRGDKQPEVVAVDIPIGLADAGSRRCDEEARVLLKGRASCVFRAPIRPMLAAATAAEARAIGRSVDGKAISAQCWAIVPKIHEVDQLLGSDESARRAVREVHPEVSFARMNGGVALRAGKKDPAGHRERLALLEREFGQVVLEVLGRRSALRCAPDDVLDAFAALWSAERIARREAISLPADPPRDAHGLAMQISA